MSIDSLLRNTLLTRSLDAPDGVGLLEGVRERSRRRQRRRLIAVVASVVLVAAAGAAVIRDVVADRSNPVELSSPEYEQPRFPFTPGWVPPGVGEPFAGLGETGPFLSYGGSGALGPVLSAHVETGSSSVIGKLAPSSEQQIMIRSHVAILRRYEFREPTMMALTWQETDRERVAVTGVSPVTADDLVRFAEAMKPEPLPVQPPFAFDLVPRGVVPHEIGRSMVLLARPPAGGVRDGAVLVEMITVEAHADATKVSVAGRAAEIVEQPGFVAIFVHLDAERMIAVRASGTLVLSRTDLLRLAAGVHVHAHALVRR